MTKLSHAQTTIDIQPNGVNRQYNLQVVRKTIALLDKMLPDTKVQANHKQLTGLSSEVGGYEKGNKLFFISAKYEKDDLTRLEPSWIIDTNRQVIGAILEVKNNYSFEIIEADPNTEEVLEYILDTKNYALSGGDFAKFKGLGNTFLRPYSPLDTKSRLGYRLEGGDALYKLSKSSPQDYAKRLAEIRKQYATDFDRIDGVKEQRTYESVASRLKFAFQEGSFEAVETFDGNKLKTLNIKKEADLKLPNQLAAYVLDEYNGLRYPLSLGDYKREAKDDGPDVATYFRFIDFGKEAGLRLGDVVGDGRKVYLTTNIQSAIKELSQEQAVKEFIRFSGANRDPHAPAIATQLANSERIGLLLDWMDWSEYRRYHGNSETQKSGASHVVYFEGGQYGVTNVETDKKVGLTENVNATPGELFEILDDRLNLGSRPLRPVSFKKGKLKSFMYYQSVGISSEDHVYFDILVERSETVDGKEVKRYEPIGMGLSAAGSARPGVRFISVRKGEKEVGEAYTNGDKLILRKLGFKFLGKEYN